MDCFDVVCLCHEALSEDAPQPHSYYINKIIKTMTEITLTNDFPPEMKERIEQIISNAKANTEAEQTENSQATEDQCTTLLDHVIALRQEVAELRQEMNAVSQVTDAVGQAVGQMYQTYVMQNSNN